MRVYLDLCCLRRLNDDQEPARHRAEAQAVELIFGKIGDASLTWISSTVLVEEARHNPSPELEILLSFASRVVPVTKAIKQRAQRLTRYGYNSYDALHLAVAESELADVLLSTDERFVALASRNVGAPRITVQNPIAWIQEQRLLWPSNS